MMSTTIKDKIDKVVDDVKEVLPIEINKKLYGFLPKKQIQSISGTGFENVYKYKIADNGAKVLQKDSEKEIYEEIQSHKADTDIYNIISRYLGGDISVLDRNKGFYADISKMPDNFGDFQCMLLEAENNFNVLPTDIKELFNNDYNQFVNKIQTDGDILDYIKSNDVIKDKYFRNDQQEVEQSVDSKVDVVKIADVKKGDVKNGD